MPGSNAITEKQIILEKQAGQQKERRFKTSQTFQTKTAFILSLATLALVLFVTVSVHTHGYLTNDDYTISSAYEFHSDRRLEDGDDGDDGEYSDQTCDDIFELTEAGSDDRCSFAQSCNGGQGLFASFIFCSKFNISTTVWVSILSPFLSIWLIILFRMLGSTAEEFFSPSLEMFSLKMGLPPRFAGVTLLAFGSGAADVSATISAIVQNPAEGYQMSMGALTGAGMFVGTVVSGIVIVIADGVKCRGALVRDLFMFVLTLLVVYYFFEQGEIGPTAVSTFFSMYITFVVVVLIADVYHRAVVLPRLREKDRVRQEQERLDQRQSMDSEVGDNQVQSAYSEDTQVAATQGPSTTTNLELPPATATQGNTPGLVTFDENPTSVAFERPPLQIQSPPQRSILRKGIDSIMVLFSNYEDAEGRDNTQDAGWGSSWAVNANQADTPVVLHGKDGILTKRSTISEGTEEGANQPAGWDPNASYQRLLDGVDTMCTADGLTAGGLAVGWSEAFSRNKRDVETHFSEYWRDIFEEEENNIFDKIFLVLEFPFTVLRKLTVPIPCEGYYCKGLVALSFALTPLWIALYAWMGYSSNLFYTSGGFPWIETLTGIAIIISVFLVRFAPSEAENMSLNVSVPIAFLGFIVAATWIDTIASQLVSLLTLLGVICRIPGSIMGITILAWGNSMGDLSANMTMARKGLANMAITACFAGPVFNILIGLGGGFSKLNHDQGVEATEVELSPSIAVGLAFLVINCLLVFVSGIFVNRGHIPKGYGYVALALYIIYIVASLYLQFSVDDD